MKFDDVLSLSMAPTNIESYIPHFYKEILHHWYENKKESGSKKKDIQNETVWFNKDILVDNTVIFYKTLYDKGMKTIKDLMSTQNSFCTALELKNKFNTKVNILSLHGILSAIPKSWKTVTENNPEAEL